MKTFKEFLEECCILTEKTFDSKEEGEKYYRENPHPNIPTWVMRSRGVNKKTGKQQWRIADRNKKNSSQKTRQKTINSTKITKAELLDMAKRQVDKSNPEERANLALDVETNELNRIRGRRRRLTNTSGVQQTEDHLQPIQRKMSNPELQRRLYKILPGHTSYNIRIRPLSVNSSRKNEPPKRGELGHTFTRSGATREALRKGDILGKQIDDVLHKIRNS